MSYASSCGRCFEVKCRGTQITSGDGSVNVDRSTACIDENKSIIIKIVDTCPCNGNEKWCCGDQNHFDLGQKAFEKASLMEKNIDSSAHLGVFYSYFTQ